MFHDKNDCLLKQNTKTHTHVNWLLKLMQQHVIDIKKLNKIIIKCRTKAFEHYLFNGMLLCCCFKLESETKSIVSR